MSSSRMLRIFIVFGLLLGVTAPLQAQIASVLKRETADPLQTGYASWIKVTINIVGASKTYLNDNFTGMEFRVDLNVDGDDNATTLPGDVYVLRGTADIYTSPPGLPGGNNDDTIYLPIRPGVTTPYPYDTNLRPQIWLIEGGGLGASSMGISGPWVTIQYPSGYVKCDDAIAPIIRQAFYYDDGSGSSTPVTGSHKGNTMPFDGYIDRIDLIWSEPMNPSNVTVNNLIFGGLGSTIHSLESVGAWYMYNSQWQRFTLWVRSNQPNTGISPTMTFRNADAVSDRFREAPSSQFQAYAPEHARTLTDRAGPAIISAHTKRAIRRQPLAAALASKRIEVTFSEPVYRNTVQAGDFLVITSATSPSANPITTIISPTGSGTSSTTYEFQLTTDFATANETGTIQYVSDQRVTDVISNYNGVSTAPSLPTVPTPSAGAVIPISDGIFPIITQAITRDAILPGHIVTGGFNGWGYLDYVDVVFDHNMHTSYLSTSGLAVTGDGILTIGGTGVWVNSTTLRVPLTQPTPKVANTGLIPRLLYANPGSPNGLIDAVSAGFVENLLSTDIVVSATNGQALQVIDMAGPAIVKALTAGTKRIRVVFSEKVNTSGWPTSPVLEESPTFKWFVGISYFDIAGTRIFFTGMSPARRDSVVYLNHTGLAWSKSDSGAINFRAQSLVYDAAVAPNGNEQYDDDLSISAPTRALIGSDVKVSRDDIAPILLRLETVDIDRNGKLDHYRCTFDDLSPIYPRRSFFPANWSITGYDGLKSGLQVDMNVYNPGYMYYQPQAINAFGDTVEAFVRFNETTGLGPVLTPYGGDTGDVPDVVVGTNLGFTDWADNPMLGLPVGLTIEKDKAGPAIMTAKTISRYDVEVFMSEDLNDGSVFSTDFFLNMAPEANYFGAWPIKLAREVSPGKVLINTFPQSSGLGWDPKDEGIVAFDDWNVVYDNLPSDANGNRQTNWIDVLTNTASRFEVRPVLPGSQVQGVPFDFLVLARDMYGNIDKNFNGYVTFSTNLQSNQITLPVGPQLLNEGIGQYRTTCWIATSNLQITASVANNFYPLDNSTSDPISVITPDIDQPDELVVKDVPGDQGGWVTLSWPFSDNHQGMGDTPVINYYEIFYRIQGDDSLHYYPQTINAYNPSGTGTTRMTVDIPVVTSDTTTFYVRAVWVPPVASYKTGGSTLSAEAPYSGAVKIYTMEDPTLEGLTTVLGTTSSAVVSGAAIGIGRAIDNIAPLSPARFMADKNGAAVQLRWAQVTRGVNGMPERPGAIRYEVYRHASKAYFDPATEGALLAVTADTSFLVNTGGLRQFFVVRAADTDNHSAWSRRVGKYGFTLVSATKPRYNYLSLPLETPIQNAEHLAQAVGAGVKVVWQMNQATNQFSNWYLPDLKFPDPPFALHTGMPVLVQVDQTVPAEWFYSGAVPAIGAIQFALHKAAKPTYNEIILPLDRPDITDADQLAADIGGVDVVYKLDPSGTGAWQYWLPAFGYGNPMTPFTIAPGEAIMLQTNKTAPDVWPDYIR